MIFLLPIFFIFSVSTSVIAYPLYAQQQYPNPREPTGRMVCSNCHLAEKSIVLSLPQSVLADSVFNISVKIPYANSLTQVLSNGKRGNLNIGAILILPKGCVLAPNNRLSNNLQLNNFFQPYSETQPNILVVGPVPGTGLATELVFPILSPKLGLLGKYSIYAGGNRGRGQIYPTGEKSNNATYNSSVNGYITGIQTLSKKGEKEVTFVTENSLTVIEKLPPGSKLIVKEGQSLLKDQPLTTNPNVGGFGQIEKEIVFQSVARVQSLLIFFVVIFFAQLFLVLKKKQFEKIQFAEFL